jgi:uncharacterized membrane protein YgdD (TMEM256/DUF423 family)
MFSDMQVSTTNYRDATRLAGLLVILLYGAAGILLAYSARRIALPLYKIEYGDIAAILLINVILALFKRFALPRAELQLSQAISTRNADLFASAIIKREMARLIQPVGGIALTVGFAACFIALHAR